MRKIVLFFILLIVAYFTYNQMQLGWTQHGDDIKTTLEGVKNSTNDFSKTVLERTHEIQANLSAKYQETFNQAVEKYESIKTQVDDLNREFTEKKEQLDTMIKEMNEAKQAIDAVLNKVEEEAS